MELRAFSKISNNTGYLRCPNSCSTGFLQGCKANFSQFDLVAWFTDKLKEKKGCREASREGQADLMALFSLPPLAAVYLTHLCLWMMAQDGYRVGNQLRRLACPAPLLCSLLPSADPNPSDPERDCVQEFMLSPSSSTLSINGLRCPITSTSLFLLLFPS